MNELFSIGHSDLSSDSFVRLLRGARITAVADVRSTPYSSRNSQFNREVIQKRLSLEGISYAFLGNELGARREESECYIKDRAKYDLISKSSSFLNGLERIRTGLKTYRVALMCSEKDPLTCHRTILICRQLRDEFQIKHILEDGVVEEQAELEQRLLSLVDIQKEDMFHSLDDLVSRAYQKQAEKIEYRRKPVTNQSQVDAE